MAQVVRQSQVLRLWAELPGVDERSERNWRAIGMWVTPRMNFGHLLLALAMTAYVLIAMRYEERDLMQRFGSTYHRWRGVA